jgi:hypothetical protein
MTRSCTEREKGEGPVRRDIYARVSKRSTGRLCWSWKNPTATARLMGRRNESPVIVTTTAMVILVTMTTTIIVSLSRF